jgi:hypothetical protein
LQKSKTPAWFAQESLFNIQGQVHPKLQAMSGPVSLTPAQLSALLEGIDWRRSVRTQAPQLAV